MTLTRLKSLLEAASPRPWSFEADRYRDCDVIRGPENDVCQTKNTDSGTCRDSSLICAAVNALPSLVAVAEAAEDAEANLHDDCGGCEKCNAIYRRLRAALTALQEAGRD